ncbi:MULTISPECIES: hypothetical protein [unclassified Methylobacterium]|uniref:hypothetical protein n=1 Tax=unclassified Methylobacterium TaxID=2615210 RepID=UPI001355E78D|nr:hypothetical protein [Methylobacterium sp. 2A]MWV20844.1 hypothetical protein [Methylobacterium sp. 2A]
MTAATPDAVAQRRPTARGVAAGRERRAWWMHILLAAAVLFAVAAANGRPSVFTDTAWYYSQGEYLATRLGLALPDLDENRRTDPTSVLPGSQAMRDKTPATIAGGRSPFYGLVLVLAVRFGTLWLLAGAQAFLAAWSICVLIRRVSPEATPVFYQGVVLALGLGTSLPFFTAFAMPDLYAGLLIIAVTILASPARPPASERFLLWLLLVASLTFHAANVALAAALSGMALAILAVSGAPLRVIANRAGWLTLAILVALSMNWVFGVIYRADTGVAQRTPPFLMARLLADGPGRDYLAAVCPNGASPTLCQFADRPFASEDEVLWSEDPSKGVFSTSDYEIRDRLRNEEPAFVSAVVARAPAAVITRILQNGLQQLMTFYVWEPMKSPARFLQFAWWHRTAILRIVPDMKSCAAVPQACDVRANPLLIAVVHIVVVMLAWIFVAWSVLKTKCFGLFARAQMRGIEQVPALAGAAMLIVTGVILNAVICGAISGVFARYQARVIWLIPLLALLIAAWHQQNRRAQPHDPLLH